MSDMGVENNHAGPNKDFAAHPALYEYLKMPKHFVGPEQADALLSIAETFIREKPYSSYLFVAGWAFAEAGLVDTDASPEVRHFRIDIARDCWEISKQKYIERHGDKEWSDSQLLTYPDRVQASMIYLPMLHDMVEGWVEQETCDTLYRRQLQLADNNLNAYKDLVEQGDTGTAWNRLGLHYELSTSLSITRLRSPTMIVLPALARSDDGTYNRGYTHDQQLLHMSHGQIKRCIPLEVKPAPGKGLRRYKSVCIRARTDLRLPSATSRFSYIEAALAEFNGEASLVDIRELNDVSGKIVAMTAAYTEKRPSARSSLTRSLGLAAARSA